MLIINRDMHVCLIDYTKGFNKVRRKDIIRILKTLNNDGKDMRIIKKLLAR